MAQRSEVLCNELDLHKAVSNVPPQYAAGFCIQFFYFFNGPHYEVVQIGEVVHGRAEVKNLDFFFFQFIESFTSDLLRSERSIQRLGEQYIILSQINHICGLPSRRIRSLACMSQQGLHEPAHND